MFVDAVDQEKAWADYLFKDGSMIGLNKALLDQYIEWIANKRMNAVGLKSPYSVPQANPLGLASGLQVAKYKLHPRNRNIELHYWWH